MWAGGLDPTYRAALPTPHRPRIRVEVWRQGVQLEPDLKFSTGSVNATLSSQVARTCSLTCAEGLFPYEDTDLLAPFGNELRVFRGVDYADGSWIEFPVFRGKIQEVRLDGADTQVSADDRAAEVQERGFQVPLTLQRNLPLSLVFQELVTGAVPDAQFGTSDTFVQPSPILTGEVDRSSLLDRVMSSVGALWYPLADGSFVIRRYPWSVPGSPVVTFADGDGGMVLASTPVRRRDAVYNQVTATSERLDGSAPAYGTASDTNPASPTYVNGPFGIRFKLLRLQYPTTDAGALGAAQEELQKYLALTTSYDLTIVPDASLELGDVIGLSVRKRTGIVQVISSFTLPLDNMSGMTVQCRAQVLGLLE